MLYGTVSAGVAHLDGETVEVLDIPYGDLGEALAARLTRFDLDNAEVREIVAAADVKPLAPLRQPRCIWATGLAYGDHVIEVAEEIRRSDGDTYPPLFMKASSSIDDPFGPIVLPLLAPDRVDYEGEVALVMGKRAKNVSSEEA